MIDIHTFRLRPGVSDEAFRAADTRVQQEFVPNLDGFVRRTTARDDDGRWVVVSLWGSREELAAADARAEDDTIVGGFLALIEDERRERFEELPG
ncbi:MAG TPA: hypothetical protein VFB78_13130 [Acidimicrobiales bacterium]|nr:hypothetical protein [Acidimicrobiales bacterium]